MKIALMSGAYVNAGDFLIEQRSQRLLEKFIEEAEVQVLKRNVPYDDKIDELNQFDLIVFGGGPGYQKNMYPDKMPFVSELRKLETSVAIMGWGWKGKSILEKELYRMSLSEQMKNFLGFVESQGLPLGCRDWYTLRFLKNQGINNVMMTGCPAWYDLDCVEDLHVNKGNIEKDDMNICISDAAFKFNKILMKPLIVFLREKYPTASMQLVFHRGITGEDMYLIEPEFLKQYRLTYRDISGSAEGFAVYDDCDLHIGFRVHAHIYNLSRGNVSVLLNEDARGNGVNAALGIMNINLKVTRSLISRNEEFLVKTVDDYLQYIVETNYLQYDNACSNIRFYYRTMQEYLKGLEEDIAR